MTFTSPVSSSRLRNVVPPAVAGRCRWVTTPATRTFAPSGTFTSSALGTTPRLASFARAKEIGSEPGDSPSVCRSADISSRSSISGQRWGIRPDHGAGKTVGTRLDSCSCRPERLSTTERTESGLNCAHRIRIGASADRSCAE